MVNKGVCRTMGCLALTALTGPDAIPQQGCNPGQPEHCAQNNGWHVVDVWPDQEFNRYIDALRTASQGDKYGDDNVACDNIQASGIDVLERALALATEDEMDDTPVYFFRGDQVTVGHDSDAAYFQGRGVDATTGDTIVYYHIFIFEEQLFQLGSNAVWEMLQHEVGHYLEMEHEDSFNNYDAQECWEMDLSEEEDDSDDAGGGGNQTVLILTTENWVCEYDVITVCEEAEDDSGETVCWTELHLIKCYQIS